MRKTFKVKGMHCKSCEMLLKDSLMDAVGIKKAEASYAKGTVSVEFDEAKTNEDKIIYIIRKEGMRY